MMTDYTGPELRSLVTEAGRLEVSLEEVTQRVPGPDEVTVQVEAAPINPSDLGLLFGPADPETLAAGGTADRPVLIAEIPAHRLPSVRARVGRSLPVGNEGAGTVVAAGANAQALIGTRVGMMGGAMYARYRTLPVRDTIALPDGASAAQGASMFVNPLTALGFVETAKAEGHGAIVHTAAASNLGQMLQRICLADGVPLVNIVRSAAQARILRDLGATYVLDSTAADFRADLADAIEQTGATVAFDAIGGGRIGSQIIEAMEAAAGRTAGEYNRYGSTTFKQLYIYGALDTAPTTLNRLAFGFTWSVSGWLLTPFLQKAGAETAVRLRRRVADELTTTFASHYSATIGLAEALDPAVAQAYQRKATGEKYLIDPTR